MYNDNYVEAKKRASEVWRLIIIAKTNFYVWKCMKLDVHRKEYTDAMNRYSGFFRISIHAHHSAMILAFYMLFETRKGTFNIKEMLKEISKISDICDLKKEYEFGISCRLQKFAGIRNDLIGHKSKLNDIEIVYEKADINIK